VTQPKGDKEVLVAAAREFFPIYLSVVHKTDAAGIYDGQAIPAAHHREMIDVLLDDSLGHSVIVMPRGAGKTTIVQAWLEWSLGRASLRGGNWAEEFRALFIANTASQAYKISNAIKNVIEFNDWYHLIFPKVKKYGEKWSETEWRVKGNEGQKDPTLQAMGITGPALGSRANVIVLDDPGDKENMATAHQRDGVRETLTNTIKPILVPGGRFILTATRWAWDDPVAWAMEQGWQTLYRKALVADEYTGEEESYWPERFSAQYLQREREADPRAFARQYQNEVAPEEGLVFQRVWFTNRFDSVPSTLVLSVGTLDTASGIGDRRSFSVNLSLAVTSDWHYYLVHMLRGQVPYDVLKETIWLTASRFGYNALIVEAKDLGRAIVADLRKRGVNVFEFHPPGQRGAIQKEAADMTTATVAAEGRLHLPSDFYCRRTGDPHWLGDFERLLFSYPDGEQGEKCDVVMSLKQGLCWLEEQRLRYQGFLTRPREPIPWAESREERVLV